MLGGVSYGLCNPSEPAAVTIPHLLTLNPYGLVPPHLGNLAVNKNITAGLRAGVPALVGAWTMSLGSRKVTPSERLKEPCIARGGGGYRAWGPFGASWVGDAGGFFRVRHMESQGTRERITFGPCMLA